MQKRSARQPRQQRSVFHRVPAPVAAPSENRVSPMCTEENARSLETPGDHGPLTGKVNPLLTGIPRKQRSQGKRERNRETRVARIKIRRVNHHLRVLQKRSQAVAVGASNEIHRAIGTGNGKRFKRAGDEIVERQKENLDTGQNHSHVRHQLAIFVAVGNQDGENVNRKEEAPEEERAFLAGPKSGHFIKRSKSSIAVSNDIGGGKIIAEEKIFEAESGDENQAASGDTRLPSAFNKKRMTRDNRGDPASECIDCTDKRQD